MNSMRLLCLVGSIALLAACGGGGGSGNSDGRAFGPTSPEPKIDFEPQNASLPSNRGDFPIEPNSPYITQLNVRVRSSDDRPAPDGQIVSLTTSDIRVLTLSILDRPDTLDNEFTTRFGTICTQTNGGLATFFLHSGPNAGTARLTASVTVPLSAGTLSGTTCTSPGAQTFAKDLIYTVTVGPAPFKRIDIRPTRTTLPLNSLNVAPFRGSPYLTEVEVTLRQLNGELQPSGVINVSVNPTTIGGFSTLDDPGTSINEFEAILAQGPVNFVAGRAILFFHSGNRAGQATLNVNASDLTTGASLSESVTFTVASSVPPIPAELRILSDSRPVYIQGSNGNTTQPLQIRVLDGAGDPVPDAPAGVNNLLLEILPTGSPGSELLTAVNAQAGGTDGVTVRTRSIDGVGQAVFRSGTRAGVFTVRATSDRADNNVDNGITNPVQTQAAVVVGDGRLFDLVIVTPTTNAIEVNPTLTNPSTVIENTTGLPGALNGTYSITVSALGTDRQGNPVLDGTPIDFGLVDFPLVGFPGEGAGQFALRGGDGDPQEGGLTFIAPTGQFQTAGGGAGPGDTLLVFGKRSTGNRDLESARTVARVNSQTDLSVNYRFNFNDDTGSSVNRGPVIPYVIGRATHGNVQNATRNTNSRGVATTVMTYPQNQLGRRVAIWARGRGDIVQGSAELISDIRELVYPGVAPATVTAAPPRILANRRVDVTVCIFDAAQAPIQGVFFGFTFDGLSGPATVDGRTAPGTVQRPTGANGCTVATVDTSGVTGGTTNNPRVIFSAGGASDDIEIVPQNAPQLIAIPDLLFSPGGRVLLRLLDANGNPIPGVLITGVCQGGSSGGGGNQPPQFVTLTEPPGVTNANGETSALITAQLNGINSFGTGTCTFSAPGGPSVTVRLQGNDACQLVSPRPPGCQNPTIQVTTLTVGILCAGPTASSPAQPCTALQNPGLVQGGANGGAAIFCRSVTGAGINCVSNNIPVGEVANLTATADPGNQFCRWVGDFSCTTVTPSVSVPMTGPKICNAIFATPGNVCPSGN